MDFNTVTKFERRLAEFWGSNEAVAVDSCTHAIELSLRLQQIRETAIPARTYVSVPMTLEKLKINWKFKELDWQEYYSLDYTNIIDSAPYWHDLGYIKSSWQCLSFQYNKALRLGRGGAILLDDKSAAKELRRMAYDGRDRDQPWRQQRFVSIGYHYYMTPETAQLGLDLIDRIRPDDIPHWGSQDYPDLRQMPVFIDIGKGV
jgi:dTDP-4-amino-4,6-dideoxygalactose transaminase